MTIPTLPSPGGGFHRGTRFTVSGVDSAGGRSVVSPGSPPTGRPPVIRGFSRRTSHVVSLPSFRCIRYDKSDVFAIRCPSTRSTKSPGRSPACSAGELGATSWSCTRPSTVFCGTMKSTVKISSGRRTFIRDPALSTTRRVNVPLRAKPSGSVGSPSPRTLTKPPSGSRFTE